MPQNIEPALFVKRVHYFTYYQFRGKVMRHLKREFMIASIIVLSIQPVRKQQKSLQTVKDIQHKNDGGMGGGGGVVSALHKDSVLLYWHPHSSFFLQFTFLHIKWL